jgi:MFS family permease
LPQRDPGGYSRQPVSAWAPLHRQAFWVILGATFVANLGVQYIAPLLPAIRHSLHLNAVEIGWVIAAYSLPSLLVTVPLGILADLWGGKRVLVACLILFGISGVATIWVTSFEQLLVLRVLQGTGNAALATLTISLLASGLPPREAALSQGYRVVVGSGAEFVQPVLAALILTWTGDWRVPFLLFLMSIGIGIWAIFGLHGADTGALGAKAVRVGFGSELGSAMRAPSVLGVTAGGFSRWFIKYAFFAYMPLYLATELNASANEIGLIVGIPGLLSAIAASQAGRFGLGRPGRWALVASLAALGAAMPAITVLHSVAGAVVFSFLMGISDGVCGPLLNAYISFLPPAAVRTTVVSVSGLMRNFGKSAAPLVAGSLLVPAGYTGALLAVGLSGLLAPLYLLGLFHGRRPEEGPAATPAPSP